jgi:hypothetical protein
VVLRSGAVRAIGHFNGALDLVNLTGLELRLARIALMQLGVVFLEQPFVVLALLETLERRGATLDRRSTCCV